MLNALRVLFSLQTVNWADYSLFDVRLYAVEMPVVVSDGGYLSSLWNAASSHQSSGLESLSERCLWEVGARRLCCAARLRFDGLVLLNVKYIFLTRIFFFLPHHHVGHTYVYYICTVQFRSFNESDRAKAR